MRDRKGDILELGDYVNFVGKWTEHPDMYMGKAIGFHSCKVVVIWEDSPIAGLYNTRTIQKVQPEELI